MSALYIFNVINYFKNRTFDETCQRVSHFISLIKACVTLIMLYFSVMK